MMSKPPHLRFGFADSAGSLKARHFQVDYNWEQQVVTAQQLRAGLMVELLLGILGLYIVLFRNIFGRVHLAAQANFTTAVK